MNDDIVPRSRLNAIEDELQKEKDNLIKIQKSALEYINKIESDALIMALRLMGEDEKTFSPETKEVMDRWRIKCLAVLQGENHER